MVLLALWAAPSANAQQTRYSLANGCYRLAGVDSAQQVRMQATALGRYLLYRPDHTFVAAQTDGSVAPAKDPSPAADWRVDDAGPGAFALTPMSGGRSLCFTVISSLPWKHSTSCPPYTSIASGQPQGGWPPTALIRPRSFAAQPVMSIASSEGKSLLISRCKRQQSWS